MIRSRLSRVVGGSQCHACRYAVLDAFTSLVSDMPLATSSGSSLTRQPLISAATRTGLSGRSFTTTRRLRLPDTESPAVAQREDHANTETTTLEPHDTSQNITSQNDAVPWYLQVSAPPQQINPLLERQKLPEIPTDSPPLLHPLLQHISVELGFDELSLLDLRHLDPPPALGAGLMMILGTARSERHLHISTDRLCRWLRADHKLTPVADGLLGRNELKLKLRRKARRAKLLSSVGASDRADKDDGVRTGWICVNVGTIPGGMHKQANEDHGPETGFVGFGAPSQGTRVVVQLLTEEKREELNLEALWGNQLKQRGRKESNHVDGASVDAAGKSKSLESQPDAPRTSSGSLFTTGQVRQYHTSRLLSHAALIEVDAAEPLDMSLLPIASQQTSRPEIDAEQQDAVRKDLHALASAGDAAGIRHRLEAAPPGIISSDEGKTFILRAYLHHLESLTPSQARKALGSSSRDYHSTPFLFSFYHTIPPFPTADHWECRVDLHCHALRLQKAGYTKSGLFGLLTKIQRSGVSISEAVFLKVFDYLLPQPFSSSDVPEKDFRLCLSVLGMMGADGHAPLSLHAFTSLFPHLLTRPSFSSQLQSLPILLTQLPRSDLRTLATDPSLLPTLLTPTLLLDHPQIFWSLFGLPPRILLARPATLYTHLFTTVAATQNQRLCADALRQWVPETSKEDPPVTIDGELAEVVLQCLTLVEGEGYRGHGGEWSAVWRQCVAALSPPPESNA